MVVIKSHYKLVKKEKERRDWKNQNPSSLRRLQGLIMIINPVSFPFRRYYDQHPEWPVSILRNHLLPGIVGIRR